MYVAVDMKTRQYDMSGRERAKTATRESIVRATIDCFMAERSFAVTLPAIADRAGVTVKTVLRHFGSRDALTDVACKQVYDEVMAERETALNDPAAAIRVLLDHYERRGLMVLAMLAEETEPRALQLTTAGKLIHREWVEEVFAAQLPATGDARRRLIDVLVVATDVYAWKLLRLDRGLSVDEVHDRITLMTTALLAQGATP